MSPTILIVEDQEGMAIVMSMAICKDTPEAKITKVRTLRAALAVIAQDPPPDITFLDLNLIGDTPADTSLTHQTLAAIPEMSKRTAVIICTGFPDEAASVDHPVISKDQDMFSAIPIAIAKLIHGGKWNRAEKRLQHMEELEGRIDAAAR